MSITEVQMLCRAGWRESSGVSNALSHCLGFESPKSQIGNAREPTSRFIIARPPPQDYSPCDCRLIPTGSRRSHYYLGKVVSHGGQPKSAEKSEKRAFLREALWCRGNTFAASV